MFGRRPSEDHYDAASSVFCKVGAFRAAHPDRDVANIPRLLHVVNPFPSAPGSEHDLAQRTTLRSVERARAFAGLVEPDVDIRLGAVTARGDGAPPLGGGWDHEAVLARDIRAVMPDHQGAAVPLIFDILTAIPVAPDDVFIFTNMDITLTPGFYLAIADIFRRGVDAAMINRRTISGAYTDPADLDLALGEVGDRHPGFDCFAMTGALRNSLIPYDGCVGAVGVMLPLTHQLLATAERPVVLLDAHLTFHIGDDKQWQAPRFQPIQHHNQAEVDRVFGALNRDRARKKRLAKRLRGAHVPWVHPDNMR